MGGQADGLAVERIAAFTEDPAGGNPAGVVLTDRALDDPTMQAVAAGVGYSETAFAWPGDGGRLEVRYFSPVAEVPFCGHATVATGALLAEREGPGTHRLATRAGEVLVEVGADERGAWAALTSVEPWSERAPEALVASALTAMGWSGEALAEAPVVAFAGARHLVLPVRERATLRAMAYDFEALRDAMLDADLTTVAVLWREAADRFHVRNAFPVGGVVEDPATGAAAAAIGGWLRQAGRVAAPVDLVLLQGEDLGRPSRLEVHVPSSGGIRVTGRAVRIPA